MIDMCTSGDVACMIAEPIQGVGGFCVPPDGFFGAMKEVLDEYGILFVSDEVQTGWGRTGEHFWGYQAHGLVPDILTFAKGVGNGLALGGVVARADIMDCIAGQLHLHLRRQPAGHRRRPGQPRVPAVPRPAGQRPQDGPPLPGAAAGRWSSATRTCRGPGPGPDAGDRDSAGPTASCTPWPEAAAALMESCRQPGAPGRQGRPVRQRAAHRTAAHRSPRPRPNEGLDIIEAAVEEVARRR